LSSTGFSLWLFAREDAVLRHGREFTHGSLRRRDGFARGFVYRGLNPNEFQGIQSVLRWLQDDSGVNRF
jgi:hypothetical protein